MCDLEASRIGAPYIYIYDISRLRVKGRGILSGWSLVALTVLNFLYKPTVVALGVMLLMP
jgi:hypothetical protein